MILKLNNKPLRIGEKPLITGTTNQIIVGECICYSFDPTNVITFPPIFGVTITLTACDGTPYTVDIGYGSPPNPDNFFCSSTYPVLTGNQSENLIITIVDSENCGGC